MQRDKALERQMRRLLRQIEVGRVPAASIIRLSAEDSHAVMEAMLHPKPPSPRLRQAAKRYKVRMGDQ